MANSVWGNAARSIFGVGVAGAFGGMMVGGWLATWGPHGVMQTIPPCQTEMPCVAVAGLDNDVFWMPLLGSQGDWEDEDTGRAVDWVRRAAAQSGVEVKVIKFPREVRMPEAGSAEEQQQRDEAVKKIAAIGKRTGADLVVVGAVESDGRRLRLAFVDPARAETFSGSPPSYDASQSDAPAAFIVAASRALKGLPPLPPPPPPPTPPVVYEPPPPVVAPPVEVQPPAVTPPAPQKLPIPSPVVPPPAPPPAPPPVVRVGADIAVSERDRRQIQRLYGRFEGRFEASGVMRIRCRVSVTGRLYGCNAEGPPRGADGFVRAVADYASREMGGTPATVNGVPEEGAWASFPVRFE